MATIRKRGKRWEAQVRRVGLAETTKTFAHKVDAEAWAAVIEAEIVRGVFTDRAVLEQQTLGSLLSRYANEVTPLKKGADAEQYQIGALRRDPLSALSLDRLNAARLASWRDHRLTTVSGSTVNRNLNLISHVLNTARREWGVPIRNPIADIRRPRNNRGRKRRLSQADEKKLLEALEPMSRNAGHGLE